MAMARIVFGDSRAAGQVERGDQCVSRLTGCYTSAVMITCFTCSSVILRAAPGCRSSDGPRAISRSNRFLHLRIISRFTSTCLATSLLVPHPHRPARSASNRQRLQALSVQRSPAEHNPLAIRQLHRLDLRRHPAIVDRQ